MSNDFTSLVKEYRNVIVLALGTLGVTLGLNMTNRILFLYLLNVYGTFEAAYGFSNAFAAVYLIAQLALIPLVLPVMGWISDRSGRKKIIVPVFLLYSFIAFLYPTIIVAPLLFYSLISGFLSSTYLPAYNALIADSVKTHRRGATFGAIAGILSLVPFVGPFIVNAVASGWNFSGVFYSSAVIILAGAILCLVFLIEPTQARANQEIDTRITDSRKRNTNAENLEQANRQKEAKNPDPVPGLEKSSWRIVIISLIMISIFLSFTSFPMIALLSISGSSILTLADVQSWLSLLEVFSLVLGGVLADLLGRKRTLLIVLEIGVALGLVVSLIFLYGQYFWSSIALMSIATFVSGASATVVLTLVADITAARRRGLTYGFVALGIGIGQLVLTFSFGILLPTLYGLNGLPVIFALTLVFIIIATILAGAGVVEPKTAY
jgi:MFS family permease